MQLSITLIRHGLTAANQERRYVGQLSNPPLAAEGRRLLEEYKARGCYPRADALYVSPLLRCQETARLIYPMLVPVTLASLTELDFGSFEGKNYDQLKDDPAYRRWIDTAGMAAPPGGEGGETFGQRLEGALRQIAEDASRRSIRCPAIVTHGGCIMSMLSRLAGQGPEAGRDFYEYQTPNGGGYTAYLDTDTLALTAITPLSL